MSCHKVSTSGESLDRLRSNARARDPAKKFSHLHEMHMAPAIKSLIFDDQLSYGTCSRATRRADSQLKPVEHDTTPLSTGRAAYICIHKAVRDGLPEQDTTPTKTPWIHRSLDSHSGA